MLCAHFLLACLRRVSRPACAPIAPSLLRCMCACTPWHVCTCVCLDLPRRACRHHQILPECIHVPPDAMDVDAPPAGGDSGNDSSAAAAVTAAQRAVVEKLPVVAVEDLDEEAAAALLMQPEENTLLVAARCRSKLPAAPHLSCCLSACLLHARTHARTHTHTHPAWFRYTARTSVMYVQTYRYLYVCICMYRC